jgi:lysyl-tRNA synthetase, class II
VPAQWTRLSSWYVRHAARLISGIALLLGLLTVVDALFVGQRYRVHVMTQVIPVPASAAATAVVFVSGLLLIRLATALRKRKRRAWRAAVVLSAALVLAHALRDERRYGEAAIGLVLLVLLIAARSQFTAKADPHSRWFALRVLLQGFTATLGYGLALVYLYPHGVIGKPSFGERVQEVLYAMVGVQGPVHLNGDRFADVLPATLLGLAIVTVGSVAWFALRPAEPIARLSDEDEKQLRDLLERHGDRDSLGYFALRRDKSVVWSPTGKAAITYRVVLGVALVSGDPIGDPEAWPGAIDAYRKLIVEQGWTPAVMGCSELGATVFKREADLSALVLGDEAVLEVADFTLDGRAMRGVRQACTKVARAGHEFRMRRIDEFEPAEIRQLCSASQVWRGEAVERGFSMALGRLGDLYDGNCVVATVHQDGALRGLLHFVPWGSDGLSLDLMRRDRDADNGLNEFMIASVVRAAPTLGVRRVSLNFAMFRDALERGERIGAGPVLRVWRSLLLLASRWWQIESLYRFNVKFRPYWEPRFVLFPSTRDLPRIAFAAMEAEAFLARPALLKRLLGRA